MADASQGEGAEPMAMLSDTPMAAASDARGEDGGGAEDVDMEKPRFQPLTAHEVSGGRLQFRKVVVPAHRYTPLKQHWMEIYTPVYDQMKIDIRMNLKARRVELKTRKDTPDAGALQKCADFVHAFMLGFDVADAIALLRLDDLYIESFEIKDVKTLKDATGWFRVWRARLGLLHPCAIKVYQPGMLDL